MAAISQKLDWRSLSDVMIVIIVLVVVKQLSLLYTIKFAGPISTFTAMIFATWRLKAQGTNWANLGFKKPNSIITTILWGALAFGVIAIGSGIGGDVAGLFFTKQPSSNRFGDLEGDIKAYVMWLTLVWTHSAFFEEMLFRAFIINRLIAFLGGSKTAMITSVIVAAIFFGYRHAYYQGWYGFITTGVIGLGLGAFYLWIGKRNLWPQILAHGTVNTIGFTLRFLGLR
jgi:membrane protease YdiL (CAAX protease family)